MTLLLFWSLSRLFPVAMRRLRGRFAMAMSVWVALVVVTSGAAANATVERVVDQARLSVGDVVESDSEEINQVDLGPTPPPGATRIVTRADVRRALLNAGLEPSALQIPWTVRVKSAARRWTAPELVEAVTPHVTARLKAGIVLTNLSARQAITVAPRATLGNVYLPSTPRREGVHRLTIMVGILTDGRETQRVALSASVDVSAAGALPDVARGAEITLVILRGGAKVAAVAQALEDADVGEVASFRVARTNAILRAQIDSRTSATVVSP